MLPDLPTTHGPAGVVVGIGSEGLETCRAAIRLGAEEATLRQVPLRLVHGSRPPGEQATPTAARMESRQQRGRRLVNGAARDLAASVQGRDLRIWTESSPRTGVDLLLGHSRTAVLLVLQRSDARDLPAGTTASAVAAAAGCATLITRPADRSAGDVGVLVVLDPGLDPAPALALALAEASLRGIGVSVVAGSGDRAAVRAAIEAARSEHPDVAVHLDEVAAAPTGGRLADVLAGAALVVVARPAPGAARGPVAYAVDGATCPVLVVRAPPGGRT